MAHDLATFFPATVGTSAAFILALFGIFRALRHDNEKRFDTYTARLEKRVESLENRLTLEQHRRFLLEAILRTSGIDVPPWAEDPQTTTPSDYLRLADAELSAHFPPQQRTHR